MSEVDLSSLAFRASKSGYVDSISVWLTRPLGPKTLSAPMRSSSWCTPGHLPHAAILCSDVLVA